MSYADRVAMREQEIASLKTRIKVVRSTSRSTPQSNDRIREELYAGSGQHSDDESKSIAEGVWQIDAGTAAANATACPVLNTRLAHQRELPGSCQSNQVELQGTYGE